MMQKRGDPLLIQNTLVALGAVAIQLAVSEARKEASERLKPPPPLSPVWIEKADDGSSEFRIAIALSSIGAWPEGVKKFVGDGEGDDDDEPDDIEQDEDDKNERERSRGINWRNRSWLPMAAHVAPLEDALLNPGRGSRAFGFAGASPLHVWGQGDIAHNLASIAERRLLEATRRGLADKPFAGHPSLRADLADVFAFLNRETDDARIAALIQGLVWVDLGTRERNRPNRGWRVNVASPKRGASTLPLAYAVLKPLFTPDRDLRIELRNAETRKAFVPLPAGAFLPVPPDLIRQLGGGRVDDAMISARHRLRASGLACLFDDGGGASPFDGKRLVSSLLIPVTYDSLASIFARAFLTDKGDADAA
jgi:CRISPR-associated protein Csx17